MRSIFIALLCLPVVCVSGFAQADEALVEAAKDRLKVFVRYDHRRVPNLETYLTRQGMALPISKKSSDYSPGDIVTWRLGGRLPHIGIVSDKVSPKGTPLIIHNIGAGPNQEDILFNYPIKGHFRFIPLSPK